MNYLMIPITNSNLVINNDYIHDILKDKFPDVYYAILNYLICDDEELISYYEELLFEILNNYSLPYYIIIKVTNNNQLFEIESNNQVYLYDDIMKYKTSEKVISTYLDNYYIDGIINLLTTHKKGSNS